MSEEAVAQEVASEEQQTEQQPTESQEDPLASAPDDLKSYVEALKTKKRDVDNENKAMRARLKEIDAARQAAEDSTKTVEQKLQEQLEQSSSKYTALLTRTINTEAKAAASGILMDPDDALRFLDVSNYTTEDGVDVAAFQKAVKDLAKQKPYLAANVQPTRSGPKPDPTQASAGNGANDSDPSAAFGAMLGNALNSRR